MPFQITKEKSCGQNLTPFKMETRVPHLSSLRESLELPSEVHVIHDPLKIFPTSRLHLFQRIQLRTKQLQQQIIPDLRR